MLIAGVITVCVVVMNYSYLRDNDSQFNFQIGPDDGFRIKASRNVLRLGKNQMLWLIASYVDPRFKNLVRVIAAGNRSLMSSKPRCNFFYNGSAAPTSESVKHYVFTMALERTKVE